jgi:hypothetical protein
VHGSGFLATSPSYFSTVTPRRSQQSPGPSSIQCRFSPPVEYDWVTDMKKTGPSAPVSTGQFCYSPARARAAAGADDEDGVIAFSLGLTSSRLAEAQPKFHPPRHDQLPSRTALTPSSLSMYNPAPYCGRLNLVRSPNSTPPQNPLPYDTKEGTSTLDANRRTSRRNEKRSGTKGNTGLLHETLEPPSTQSLFCSHYTFHIRKSLLPFRHCLYISRITVSPVASICLSVRY